jgi:hypothetical protein
LQASALGGGEAARAKQLARGKLPPRERVALLLDPGTPFLEFSPLAAHGMYKGDAPCAGVIAGIGRVSGVDRLDLPRSLNPATVVLGLNGSDGYAIDGLNDMVSGLPGRDVLRGIENVRGTQFDDQITGNEAANRLEGLAGNDTLRGGTGNDTLNGGDGNDSLDGGEGDDTAVFKGERSEYQWSANNGKVAIIGPDGADDLVSIEFLQFSDQLVSLRADTTAPKLQSIAPTQGSASVPLDANVVVQFDEPIKLGSGNISVSFGSQTVLIGADRDNTGAESLAWVQSVSWTR